MCEYCGCLDVTAILLLTQEHDQILLHVRDLEQAVRDRDLAAASAAGRVLAAGLAPHSAVEERGLFPAMREAFPEQIDALTEEHRSIERSLADLASWASLSDEASRRLLEAMTSLRNHIRKEEDGVFPASLGVLSASDWDSIDAVRSAVCDEGALPDGGPLTDLASRADLERLLVRFYGRAMLDVQLGPVFVDVAHLDLSVHLPRIADFWERWLLGTGRYDGRPMVVHRELHAKVALTPSMFERWLALWTECVDATAAGPVADQAKALAAGVAEAILRTLSECDAGRAPAPLPLLANPKERA